MSKILHFFYKIVRAIKHLHKKGIVHRDLKPENILITKNFSPKLSDFGTSTHFRNSQAGKTFCGTYEYMAPEVFLRKKQTSKVDVWSLGVMLYELLHKKIPFFQISLQEIRSIIKGRKLHFRSDISKELKELILSMLAWSSKDRPSCSRILAN